MKKLDEKTFDNMASKYLMGGYKTDTIKIDEIIYDDNDIVATISVTDYLMPSDGKYHFTAFHTQLLISQLVLIQTYLCKGLDEKPGEAYMRDFSMKLKKQINKTEGIQIRLSRKKIKNTSRGIYMNYDFSVENNSFSGTCTGIQF